MRSTKSEWFSRLRFGASGKTSRQRPSVVDGHAQTGHTGSSTRPIARPSLERAPLESLDIRLQELQIQALEDEHDLHRLKMREHKVNIENGEIKRDLTLAGVVVIGAMLVAGGVLGIADPSLGQPSPNLFEFCKLLLG